MLQARHGRAAGAKEVPIAFPLAWDSQRRASLGEYYRSCGVRYILAAKHT